MKVGWAYNSAKRRENQMRRCRVLSLEGTFDDLLPLHEAAIHYLCHVLRLENGTYFRGFDGHGSERTLCLIQASNGLWKAQIKGAMEDGLKSAPILLCYGLPKGDKLETVARQVTEMGIQGMMLWAAQRSVVVWEDKKQEQKHERLLKVMQEASRQCERASDPSLSLPYKLKQLIDATQHCAIRVFFDPQAQKGWEVLDEEIAKLDAEHPCAILIGPEGGISPEEKNELQRAGWRGIVLNCPILRTETAAVVACCVALDRLGWMA
jgi:16S rRNA (uracil1498-N3)-methyltransferase